MRKKPKYKSGSKVKSPKAPKYKSGSKVKKAKKKKKY